MSKPVSQINEQASLGYKLARINWYQRLLLHGLFKKHDVEITNEQWVVLKTIQASPGLSQSDIALRSLKDKTNITRILDLLEKKSLIERRRAMEDRRRFEISLTKRGAEALSTVAPAIREGESILRHGMTETELRTFMALLDKLRDNLKSEI